MKRIFLILTVLVFLFPISGLGADTKNYTLSLGSAISGNLTTASSAGTSIFAITSGPDIVRSGASVLNIAETDGTFYGFQITGITVSQAQQTAGGDYSGNTITVRYKETLKNETRFWDAAQTVDIISAMALSGNTLYQVSVYPAAMGFIKLEALLSGVTPLDGMTAVFTVR